MDSVLSAEVYMSSVKANALSANSHCLRKTLPVRSVGKAYL